MPSVASYEVSALTVHIRLLRKDNSIYRKDMSDRCMRYTGTIYPPARECP